MILGFFATDVGMPGYQEHQVGAWYVRTNKVRLGNPEAWGKILRLYGQFNTHLPMSLLASQLSDEELTNIHERMVIGEKEQKGELIE